ncbi:MAG: chloride channel protein [Halieaceae bacterium]|nr:chloride channel protein [Halieaceae bacterium]
MILKTLRELITIIFVACLIGAAMSLVTNMFVSGVEAVGALRAQDTFFKLEIKGQLFSVGSVVFLWITAFAVYFVKTSLGIKAWAGPADSIYAAHQSREPLDLKRGFGSTFAAFLSASGGAAVGQYGPLVHFGATMGVWVKRFLSPSLSNEVYLGCGVAAAISAGFNAPIAGIIFAHEAILRLFSIRAVAPISIAAITASAVDRFLFPSDVTFAIEAVLPPLIEILPALIAITPILSLVALAFMLSLRTAQRTAAKFRGPPFVLTFLAATLCGLLGVFLPDVLGLGMVQIKQMLSGEFALSMLVLLLLGKLVATTLCIGFGLFGGVFGPAIFIGIAAGGVLGGVAEALGLSNFALVASVASMAAVSASVIGAPITATIIILELTQSYEFAVAAMVTVMLCNLITQRVFALSFFDRQLLDRGVDLRGGREAIHLNQIFSSELATNDGIVLDSTTDGNQARAILEERSLTEAYICGEGGVLMGKVSLFHTLKAQNNPVKDYMDTDPFFLSGTDTLAHAMSKVANFVGESIPIVDKETGILIGTVTEGDLFNAVIGVQGEIVKQERG